MKVNMEKNTIRKYHRIELPAKVRINEKWYNVKDWSLGGFMVMDVTDVFEKEINYDVKLLLPFDSVEIIVDVTAKVAWSRNDRAGFSFVNLSSKAKNILKTYLKDSIEGNLGEIDGVLAYVDSQEIPLPIETPMTSDEEIDFQRSFYKRSIRYIIIALSVVAIALVIVFSTMTRATSLRAVVSSAKVNVDAPFDGMVTNIYVKSGDSVKKNQILAILDNSDIKRSVETQRYAVSASEKELHEAKSLLRMAKNGKYVYSKYSVSANLLILNSEVGVKAENLNEEKSKLRELLSELDKANLRSPCDGFVYVCKPSIGSSVRKYDQFFILQPNENANMYILARFTFDAAKGISPGSTADVFIPSLGKRVKGTVRSMGTQALGGAEGSLDLEISTQEVPVAIVLNDNSLNLKSGISAIVDVRTPIKARLKRIL